MLGDQLENTALEMALEMALEILFTYPALTFTLYPIPVCYEFPVPRNLRFTAR